MVDVFREVRRVLRSDGVCFLNLGDSYVGGGRAGKDGVQRWGGIESGNQHRKYGAPTSVPAGMKPKDLVGVPWTVALALRSDGWWLRRDIVWAKALSFCPTYSGAVMPESPTDRPTSSHEYVFVLSKAACYFWDYEGVRERGTTGAWDALPPIGGRKQAEGNKNPTYSGNTPASDGNRNLRSVWTIPTEPFPGEFCAACGRFYADGGRHLAVHRDEETEKETKVCACGRWDSWLSHFATFPQRLVEPMIKAGTSEKGRCLGCGMPLGRVVKKERRLRGDGFGARNVGNHDHGQAGSAYVETVKTETVGWKPGCGCGGDPVPCAVLDPFMGAGTTGLVALKLGRDFTGIELNPDYAEMARKRILQDAPLFNEVELLEGAKS